MLSALFAIARPSVYNIRPAHGWISQQKAVLSQRWPRDGRYISTLCSEKNTHSHFLSYLHELFVDLNKNCSEYTQGLIDSDNVKIRYSLWSMT